MSGLIKSGHFFVYNSLMLLPKFFRTQNEFRKWLEKNHDKKLELLVGFYKIGSGKPSITWSESVDQALCFGWIDGVRKRIDDESYSIRFTPRRPTSVWSAINIKKVEDLSSRGLMQPSGVAAFEKRDEKRSAIYSYENRPKKLGGKLEDELRQNENAWTFFQKQPQSYKQLCAHYVMSAKQEKTRISRLKKLILASEAGKRL
jgi:uncharacterized protein YdeI (YjbR/CyaY-like superfamily)